MIRPGDIVLAHLINPSEKLWGVLEELSMHGVTLRALGVESFEDWVAQALRKKERTLGLTTVFIPLFRVEKIYLDEEVGELESYQQRFRRRVGLSVQEHLGIDPQTDDDERGALPS